MTEGTAYALKNGLYTKNINENDYKWLLDEGYSSEAFGRSCGCWWLRSPGLYSINACSVSYYGNADWGFSTDVSSINLGVRPAIYIEK